MIISNMTEDDWLAFQKEAPTFLESGQPYDEECVDVLQQELPLLHHEVKAAKKQVKKKKKKKNQFMDDVCTHKVIAVGRCTAKARFFITEETAFHTHGFWCPNAAVKKYVDNKHVVLEDWFDINIIEWNG